MSVGLGIFLSAALVTLVILYGITKDRWSWRRTVKRLAVTFLALVVIAAAGIGGLYIWKQVPETVRLQTEYAGIRIGMTQAEVMYVKGYPPNVFGESEKNEWGGQPVIQTDNLEKGTQVQDYRDWSYDAGQSRIDITFNEAKSAVVAVQCYSTDRFARCPSIASLTDGVSEKFVVQRLGNPDASRIQGVAKYMAYRDFGIHLWLAKEQVYMLGINDPKYEQR